MMSGSQEVFQGVDGNVVLEFDQEAAAAARAKAMRSSAVSENS
jgi:hypothetical protein